METSKLGKKRIGILGGSFDPIHNGHLHMAVCAKEEYALDEVWLIPAGHSPNKDETKMTSAEHRYAMTCLAVQNCEGLQVSSIEMESEQRSYTWRTLEKLHTRYPDIHFYFIMGADSLDYFDKWAHPERICQYADLLVIHRDDFAIDEKMEMVRKQFHANVSAVSCEKYPISSTQLREMIKNDGDCARFLPENVLRYIAEQELYKR